MDIDGIRQALHKQPFEPFQIRLADGRALAVPHPDFVAVAPQRIVVVGEDSSWTVIEPLLVVSLDYVGAQATPPQK
ncbi:MAG: hypothetical protein O2960_04780 [Verrucomicrobia bacterium]|nr:hypothetical protein [Verrucomicrobiota bacterium]